MLKSINTKLITRVILCLALAFVLWCRGQTSDDTVFIQYPNLARVQVQNEFTGVCISFAIDYGTSRSSGFTSNEWFGGDAQPKYSPTLWHHVYFNCSQLFLSVVSQGALLLALSDPGQWQIGIVLPHALLIIPLLLLVRLETRVRKRKYKPGLCQHCGYDVRFSKDRCSECGSSIASMSVAATARRFAKLSAIACPVTLLTLHALCVVVAFYGMPIRAAVAPLDKITSFFTAWPIQLQASGPLRMDFNFTTCLLIGLSVSMNCLFWGWILEKVALTLQWFWECVVKLRGQKHNLLPQPSAQ